MPCKVKKSGAVKWLASVMKEGRRRQKVFDTKAEALEWEAEQRKATSPMTPTVSLTLLEWATQYLNFSEKFSSRTMWEKKAAFKELLKKVDPASDPAGLQPGQVLKALQPVAKSQSGHAANKMRKNLMAAWNWGVKYLSFQEKNPCKIDRFPEAKSPRYVPSEQDFWTAYDAANLYDQRMLLAYLNTAARKRELFGMTWADVDFDNRRVRLWTAKREGGAKEFDWIPMTEALFKTLVEERQHASGDLVFPDPETGKAFTSRQHYLERLCKRAGVRKFCWHAIRHLSASILIQNQVPLPTIQKILRHKNLTTTQGYIHELDNARDLMEVLSRTNKSPRTRSSHPRADLVAVK
ncbi:tyrosine-type recombinase/integrase [Desulfolutivibrio sulfoxidireducens]|uniref:tyrosine-type recombinase/integrase n=1 Tax=Desulfolutivibrio sulfoxidireducens TaxID=2773299 RepID=UPI00159D0BBA|nr:integrase [Desulfolutivibrio sulfoxidireducens]QLA16727.1 tyrosine-type recombinase/integrase [Desulfolutivibrio sulfoxidireducens]